MAWGYWSATSVSDRGRSPRREKDKQHQSLHQYQSQQAQQQMHQSELSTQSAYGSVQQERELGVATPGVGAAAEEPPCSMMIQSGSFYSYSAAAAAASRRISTVEGGGGPSSVTSTGIQVLPRERHVKPGSSAYPPSSPGSGDSAEYEQPLAGHFRAADISPPPSRGSPPSLHHHHHHHHDDIFVQPGASSSRVTKLLQCPPPDEGMDELSEAELEEVAVNAELIYGRIGPTATCRLHGPCGQQPLPPLPPESAPSMTSLLEIEPAGPSQFQFNEITWGRCEPRWRGCAERLARDHSSLSSLSPSSYSFSNAALIVI